VGSDHYGEFVERGGDSEVSTSGVHAEFVVAAAQVLYERVPADHHLRSPVRLQPRTPRHLNQDLWVPDTRPWVLTSTSAFSSPGPKVATMVPNGVESQIRRSGIGPLAVETAPEPQRGPGSP
jgi:hypothetical protein